MSARDPGDGAKSSVGICPASPARRRSLRLDGGDAHGEALLMRSVIRVFVGREDLVWEVAVMAILVALL
jgi:hypothetical protein